MAGFFSRNSVRTIRWVVTNLPPGHSVFSSTSTLPPPSRTSRDAHGSGTQAPSIFLSWKSCRVVAFSLGSTCTSPCTPWLDGVSPFSFSQARSATSWVLPSCGEAIRLPLRSAAELMPGWTTSEAPPEVAPEMIRMPSPLVLAYALIAGLGPMKPASRSPPSSASISAGPALKVCVSSLVEPSRLPKKSLATPTTGVACVTFGK